MWNKIGWVFVWLNIASAALSVWAGKYLFVFSGQYPTTSSPLSRALGTDLQAAGTTASPTTGLTSYRAPGEIEGEEGINRQNVWNEASLRLKDALGL